MEQNNNNDKSILCVGLICLDIVNICNSFPKENSDQRVLAMNWQKGGNAVNTSCVLAMLGNKVDCFSSLPDTEADYLTTSFVINQIKEYGVGLDNVVLQDDGTLPCSTVIVNKENGSRTITHFRRHLPEPTLEDFQKVKLNKVSWVIFEGRNLENVFKMIDHVINYNNKVKPSNQIKIAVELEKAKRIKLHHLAEHADLVILSEDYALKHGLTSAKDAVEAYKKKAKQGAYIVCAWGKEGAASGVVGVDDDITMTPSYPPEKVVDTLGAGDTFNAGLVHALSRGRDLKSSVNFGCYLAGFKVGTYGYDAIRDLSPDVKLCQNGF